MLLDGAWSWLVNSTKATTATIIFLATVIFWCSNIQHFIFLSHRYMHKLPFLHLLKADVLSLCTVSLEVVLVKRCPSSLLWEVIGVDGWVRRLLAVLALNIFFILVDWTLKLARMRTGNKICFTLAHFWGPSVCYVFILLPEFDDVSPNFK